ncbi:tetratricopeptide repeat protein, partial [Rhodothermus marinus]|uniref:tetratricopeptide repeat protein n=1 Tax=Rhodothermus marinus TaxID=29549 RepID=UPI000ABD109B
RHLIEQQPEDPQARQEHALLQDLLRRDSTHVEALRLLARLYRDERPDWSAELLTRSLQYDPRDLSVWTTAARTWLAAGMPRRGAEVAEEALFLFPDQPPLLRLAAYAHLSLGRPDAALPHVETLLKLLRVARAYPGRSSRTPRIAGASTGPPGALRGAREACRQARRLDDRSAAVRLHCAVVDWLAGGPQEATLQEAQAALPDPPEPG